MTELVGVLACPTKIASHSEKERIPVFWSDTLSIAGGWNVIPNLPFKCYLYFVFKVIFICFLFFVHTKALKKPNHPHIDCNVILLIRTFNKDLINGHLIIIDIYL